MALLKITHRNGLVTVIDPHEIAEMMFDDGAEELHCRWTYKSGHIQSMYGAVPRALWDWVHSGEPDVTVYK